MRRHIAIAVLCSLMASSLSAQGPLRDRSLIGQTAPGWNSRTAGIGVSHAGTPVPAQPQANGLQWGWGTGFGIEPLVGRVSYHDDTKLEENDFWGAMAGLHIGRGTLVRGFYWRGMEAGMENNIPLQSYGGEFQFDLFGLGPVRPFLLGGVGRLDFMEGYTDTTGATPEDATTLLAGGGLRVELTEWLSINGTYRSTWLETPLATEAEPAPEGTAWRGGSGYSVGVTLRFGGTPGSRSASSTETAREAVAAGNVAIIPLPPGGEVSFNYNRGDSAVAALAGVPRDSAGRAIFVGTAAADAVRSLFMTELGYIDGLYPETAALGEGRTPVSGERLDTLSRRVSLRMNEVFDYVSRQEAQAIRASLSAELARAGITGRAAEEVMASTEKILIERVAQVQAAGLAIRAREDTAFARRQEQAARGRTASAFIGGFSEFYVGGRTTFRSKISPNLRFTPEATLGFFGGGVSVLIAANAQYDLAKSGTVIPYLALGAGLRVLSDSIGGEAGSSFVFNPAIGANINSNSLQKLFGTSAKGYFIEVQGVDFFNNTRVLLGVNWQL